ncbi:NAD(P)-binding domain protein [Metarhizium album ARSEF 1941]|uniref:NAD(P)-binding domain protein n=1 Tax=Metarhizium album (strain ARSEF 1941) TaxID=1081103 RepID=A0A0B2WDT6_METAS|nr:NAD(P)-binding domain protein [Metarhizium album ARSEF 1941]KHN94041.1 NAD(P)-binding domain protein [Metarhizium album ARSEF 1941]
MAEPYNTPVPGSTPRSGSPVPHPPRHPTLVGTSEPKPRVLHLGDPIRFNHDTFELLSSQYEVVRPSADERQRAPFIQGLRAGKWGSFQAMFRPSWRTGGEMGRWDDELIALLPSSVRVFASAGAGYDWVETKLLGERGIIYCNGGAAAADAVADLAVAMVISTFRRIPWCVAAATAGSPSAFSACHLDSPAQCHNLRRRVLGIVGLGSIGQRVATRCRFGFDMDIRYFDTERKPAAVERALSAGFHESMESLLQAADCVVLCTPAAYGGGTLIDSSTLKHFPRGGRFVNVSRGALVNEDDLVAALETGRLSSVALDVHANEPHVHQGLRRLAAEGRAMLTCHNGGGTVETHEAFEELSMRNVLAVLGGGPALSAVNMGDLKK